MRRHSFVYAKWRIKKEAKSYLNFCCWHSVTDVKEGPGTFLLFKACLSANFSGTNWQFIASEIYLFLCFSYIQICCFISHLFAQVFSAALINIFPMPKTKGENPATKQYLLAHESIFENYPNNDRRFRQLSFQLQRIILLIIQLQSAAAALTDVSTVSIMHFWWGNQYYSNIWIPWS